MNLTSKIVRNARRGWMALGAALMLIQASASFALGSYSFNVTGHVYGVDPTRPVRVDVRVQYTITANGKITSGTTIIPSELTDASGNYVATFRYTADSPTVQGVNLSATVHDGLSGYWFGDEAVTHTYTTINGAASVALDPLAVVPVFQPAPIVVQSLTPTGITASGATMNAKINPQGNEQIRWSFQYSWDSAFAKANLVETPSPQVSAGAVADLDGVNDHLVATSGVYFTGGDFTVEGWVLVRSITSWSKMIDFGNAAFGDNVVVALSDGVTGKPSFVSCDGSTVAMQARSSVAIREGAWTHIAAVRKGSSGLLYLNGSLVASNVWASGKTVKNVTRSKCYIGRSNDSGNTYANALFDDIRIWNVARTQSQIDTGRFEQHSIDTGCIANWRFDETSGSGAVNSGTGGSAYNATFYSGSTADTAGRADSSPASYAPADYLASVQLTSLYPDTTNYYRVLVNGAHVGGNATAVQTIATLLPVATMTVANKAVDEDSGNFDVPITNISDGDPTSARDYTLEVTLTNTSKIQLLGLTPTTRARYQKISGDFTWAEAQRDSIRRGGKLAKITSQAENDLVQAAAGTTVVWIGLSDAVTEGTYKWTTGETMTFSKWGAGQPNNSGDQDVVQMDPDGTWNDASVVARNAAYIIEYPDLVGTTYYKKTILASAVSDALSFAPLFNANGDTSVKVRLTAEYAGGRANAVEQTIVLTLNSVIDQPTAGTGSGIDLVAGANSHLVVPADTHFSGPFTVESWVYVRSYTKNARLFDFGNGPASDNVIGVLSSGTTGKPAFTIYSGSTPTTVSATEALPKNQWAHIAFVYNGTSGSIFVNGVEKARGAMPTPAAVVRNSNYIGRSNTSSDAYTDMALSEFRIWNAARELGDLALFSKIPLAGDEAGLRVYYRAIEGAGPVIDWASDASQGGHQDATRAGTANFFGPSSAQALPMGTLAKPIPVGEDSPLRFGLPANIFESALLGSSWSIVTAPTKGTLTADGSKPGVYTYMPLTNKTGTDQFTYKITDAGSRTVSWTVYLNIIEINDPPDVSFIPNQNYLESTTNVVQFTASDQETTVATNLLIAVTSSDQTVVPNSGLSISSAGANRTLTIRPNPGESGATTITISVTDTGTADFAPRTTVTTFSVIFEPLPAFSIIDLGVPLNFAASEGVSINDRWEVLGNATRGASESQAFLYHGPGGPPALTTYTPQTGDLVTKAAGVNGQPVVAYVSNPANAIGKLILNDGLTTTIVQNPVNASFVYAAGITEGNGLVGSALFPGGWQPFRAVPGGSATAITLLSGYTSGWGYAMDQNNTVVGVFSNATTHVVRGFSQSDAAVATLFPILPGGTNNTALAMNDDSEATAVVGWSETKLVDGTVLDLTGGRYVDLPDNTWMNGGSFTVESWVYLRSYKTNMRLVEFGNGPASDNVICSLSSTATSRPRLQIFNGSSPITMNAPSSIPLNTWTHIAYVFNSTNSTAFIYVNAVQAITATLQMPRAVNRTANFIGHSSTATDGVTDALIENLRIWNVARTPTDLAADKETPTAVGNTNLFVEYLFDEAFGATAHDSSTNKLDGTLIGGSVFSNPNGLAYGPVAKRATLYQSGNVLNLGRLPGGGDGMALGVNHFGKIVGSAIASGQSNATLYAANILHNINNLLTEEDHNVWQLQQAQGINRYGAIVGTGRIGGSQHGFMALPATIVGQKVVRPPDTVADLPPDIEIIDTKGFGSQNDEFFFWSPSELKLFATRPCIARLRWHITTAPTDLNRVEVITANIWPRNPTLHVVGAPVDLEPTLPDGATFPYVYQQLHYPDEQTLSVVIDSSTKTFDARKAGYSVVRYLRNNGAAPDPGRQASYFEVVRSYDYTSPVVFHDNVPWTVGDVIDNPNHFDYGKNGWVILANSFYDGDGPDRAYDRPTRMGPIIPVNKDTASPTDDLVVAWYSLNKIGVAWAGEARRYSLSWPENTPNKIIIASTLGTGSLDPAIYKQPRVYIQPDATKPGFNPNEEHALMASADTGMGMFALRNDLNQLENFSEPYALLKYKNENDEWRIKVYKVVAEEAPYFFRYRGLAGTEISPPHPLDQLQLCYDTYYDLGQGWEDFHGKIYARAAGQYGDPDVIRIRYSYPLQPDFYAPLMPDGARRYAAGECVPWLDRYNNNTPGTPNGTLFDIYWPDDAPILNAGQTDISGGNGLPNILNMADVKVVYDDQAINQNNTLENLARLYDPLATRTLKLAASEAIPSGIVRQSINGKDYFSDLPWVLRTRLTYDPINRWLMFSGYYQADFDVGDPLLLPNVLTGTERDRIKKLAAGDANWAAIVDKIYDLSRNPNQLDTDWDGKVDQKLLIGLDLATNVTQMTQGRANNVKSGNDPDIKAAQVISTVTLSSINVSLTYRYIVPQQFGPQTKALTAGASTSSAAPRPGNALQFDGVNDNATLPTGVSLSGSSFTVEFWAARATTSTADSILSQGSTTVANQGLHIGFLSNSKFTFAFKNNDLITTAALTTDTIWHHYACAYNADTRKRSIYRDGRLVISDTATANYTGTGDILLGQLTGSSTTYFGGRLDELRIWTRERNSFEVRRDMAKRLIGNEQNLVVYLRFDDSVGSTAVVNAASSNASGLPLQAILNGPVLAQSDAPAAIPPRFMTVAENDNPALGALPIKLHVIRVDDGPYAGDLKILLPDNVFDERLTIRQSPDFGGDPSPLTFEWYYQPATSGQAPDLPDLDVNGEVSNTRGWIRFNTDPVSGGGVNQITIGEGGESSIVTLSDNWIVSRYKGYTVNGATDWSDWIGDPASVSPRKPVLAEGWIKRVIRGLNPFDQRIADFRQAEVSTIVSMIGQAGQRYEGDIAFNPSADAINGVGLIEAYETVVRRGRSLSIEGTPGVNFAPANNAILLASTKIADLYTLLGNEAYSDAQDPTIGFGTVGTSGNNAIYGSLASSIFAFQNQLDSLLEEELVLLRGRDNRAAGTQAAPVYNRLFWNFTLGDGEVAYQQNYNITDQNRDGFIDARDARTLYPQGHGDAWGHYLKALKVHYDLLRHPNFTWIPTTEAVSVAGAAIEVDFQDERKFARTAGLKAKSGAEIVDLTYRMNYVEDPDGQWQGYKDTDTDRAWGVSEWGRRAGLGAYFDWLAASTILPATDPNPAHTGIQKVDRTTVPELREIVVAHDDILRHVEMADEGLNPLGLTRGVVPFDIDPAQVSAGKTHFEQVADRALKSMNNAIATWNEANQASELLRQNQDTLEQFRLNVQDQERDYKNRMIEIYGYPYAGDIGPGKTYPSGYDGPDIYHYMYVNTVELNNDTAPASQTFTAFFSKGNYGIDNVGDTSAGALGSENQNFFFPEDIQGDISDRLASDTMLVTMPYTTGDWGFSAPSSWGARRAPGEIQVALSEMIQDQARLEQANLNYDNCIRSIEEKIGLIEARYNLRAETLQLEYTAKNTHAGLSVTIAALKATQKVCTSTAASLKDTADILVEALPKVVGLANDTTFAARGTMLGIAKASAKPFSIAAALAEAGTEMANAGIQAAEGYADFQIVGAEFNYEILQQIRDLEATMREEAGLRVECFRLAQAVDLSLGKFKQAVAKGDRMTEERLAFRQRTAGDVSNRRYQDMTFRVFRNDALQKYRAQFDLAQRYVYLAATAYDYEVNLLGTDSRAGQSFLTDIIRQRALGQMRDGVPVAGAAGLADSLARLTENFAVLKTQLGFNNPQTETGRFSLRNELFRLRGSSDADWRNELARARVTDLWQVPEFRRFCRPFAPESAGAQPGMVIRFSTAIRFGENFFGRELSGGDSAYDPSRFATKARSVGIWFTGYNGNGMSVTPRVYLIPAGVDILRSPTGNDLTTRQWRVMDQALPVPFTLGSSQLSSPSYIPVINSLGGSFAEIRRFSSFRAYHDSGSFTESEAISDSRLIGRSVWNTEWLLIIPGGTLLNNANTGLDEFIASVSDIKLFFQTYSYAGN